MEKNLRSYIALEYLLIKYNLIDKFAKNKYEEGKWCLNRSTHDLFEICYFENGKKTKTMSIRYPEFACCYVLDILTNDNAKDLIVEFCSLIAMDINKFNNLTYSFIASYHIEQAVLREIEFDKKMNLRKKLDDEEKNYTLSDAQLNYLAKRQIDARREIEQKVRIRTK